MSNLMQSEQTNLPPFVCLDKHIQWPTLSLYKVVQHDFCDEELSNRNISQS